MNTGIALLILFILAAASLLALAWYFGFPPFAGSSSVGDNVRSMVQSQRDSSRTNKAKDKNKRKFVDVISKEEKINRTVDSKLTLEKKLRYAQWSISPVLFHVFVIIVSLLVFLLVRTRFNFMLQLVALTSGPIFMNWLLSSSLYRRFQAFDKDYPSFLLSLVGLLKTGMNTIQALDAAAEGLEDNSLVKQEVELMLERLKMGVPEDQSIGSFGEDIYHEEIELFVQALLLSRRVGGNLSDTLDRLAKQVRKRQYFRYSAYHAVGMQRGSIWIIILVLIGIMTYMYFVAPSLVTGAWGDEMGWQVWQGGVVVILFGIFWIRQVTKIRV